MRVGESRVAGRGDVIVHGDEKQRRRVGRCEGIRKSGPPVHEAGGLRDLVLNFAILALILGDKIQRGLGGLEIAD